MTTNQALGRHTAAQAAAILGVTRQRVYQLKKSRGIATALLTDADLAALRVREPGRPRLPHPTPAQIAKRQYARAYQNTRKLTGENA